MKIMIAIDGSSHAERVLTFVKRLPFAEPPEVTLVHVCPVADTSELRPHLPSQVRSMVRECQNEGREILQHAVQFCQNWAKSVDCRLLAGPVVREVVQFAAHLQVELVVAGARGKSGIDRFLLGSVSEAIARHAHCSTLVIRPPDAHKNSDHLRILCATDGSATGDLAATKMSRWSFDAQTDVEFISVYDWRGSYQACLDFRNSFEGRKQLEASQSHLQQLAARLSAAPEAVHHELLPAENAAEGILDRAQKIHADMIVVGNQGKTVWERMLLGSTSMRVLQYASCSVWIERPECSCCDIHNEQSEPSANTLCSSVAAVDNGA